MIEGTDRTGFRLICDNCERKLRNRFNAFALVVEHKKKFKWKSILGKKSQVWHEICPDCAESEDVVAKFRSM